MASLAHISVGLAAGRAAAPGPRFRLMAAFAALSMLPDLDVLAFRLGIPYAAPFGHRGATHSILFALVAGGAFAALAGRSWRFALFACATALSHPLLDALTDGGLGVALFWPFSNARYFAPWRPIPVAPIGARILGARGLHILAQEALWTAPLLIYALWPRRAARR